MTIQKHKLIKDINTSLAVEAIENWINAETNVLSVTITSAGAGVGVAVAHGLNYVPSSFTQCQLPYVAAPTATGQGVLFGGTTTWTATNIYVTATATGLYHLRVRR